MKSSYEILKQKETPDWCGSRYYLNHTIHTHRKMCLLHPITFDQCLLQQTEVSHGLVVLKGFLKKCMIDSTTYNSLKTIIYYINLPLGTPLGTSLGAPLGILLGVAVVGIPVGLYIMVR